MMETYNGWVRTPVDAILLFEACRLGMLPRVQRRLSERERQLIKPGSVFVWDEREAGMRRWTDGKSWSASRVSGSFLTYREMEGRRSGGYASISNSGTTSSGVPGEVRTGRTPDSTQGSESDADNGSTAAAAAAAAAADDLRDGFQFKPDGLIKQSFSITTSTGNHLHLINYYSRIHPPGFSRRTPTNDPQLRHIQPIKGMYPESATNEISPPSASAKPHKGDKRSIGEPMVPLQSHNHQHMEFARHTRPQWPPTPPPTTTPTSGSHLDTQQHAWPHLQQQPAHSAPALPSSTSQSNNGGYFFPHPRLPVSPLPAHALPPRSQPPDHPSSSGGRNDRASTTTPPLARLLSDVPTTLPLPAPTSHQRTTHTAPAPVTQAPPHGQLPLHLTLPSVSAQRPHSTLSPTSSAPPAQLSPTSRAAKSEDGTPRVASVSLSHTASAGNIPGITSLVPVPTAAAAAHDTAAKESADERGSPRAAPIVRSSSARGYTFAFSATAPRSSSPGASAGVAGGYAGGATTAGRNSPSAGIAFGRAGGCDARSEDQRALKVLDRAFAI